MTRHRIVIAVLALVGALLGAALGFLLAPSASRYSASAKVAFLPAPDLTTVDAGNFWEVLTRGQVSRTGAIVYDDPRWLPSAAKAAKVAQDDLSLQAAALPETTMVVVTVQAGSADAAESALNDVLTTATREVTALVVPYSVKVLWPPEGNADPVPAPSHLQVAAAGALGGLLVGAAAGWLVGRTRRQEPAASRGVGEAVDKEVQPRS